jgi:hypothetical protein
MNINYTRFYKLVDKTPVPCSFREWETWYVDTDRRIKKTQINTGNVVITTSFIGIAVMLEDNRALLFETYVSGGFFDGYIKRFKTYDEAIEGHKKVVYKVLHPTMLDKIKYYWKKLTNKFKEKKNYFP